MVAAVAEIQNQRCLRIGAHRGRYARRLARWRRASVGGNRQRSGNSSAISEHCMGMAGVEAPTLDHRLSPFDAGMRGDLLTLRVALAPCVVGYAEIAARLAARPGACAATNPYRVWIEEYAGAPYQQVATSAREHLDRLANLYVTPAREAELVTIFKEATRLEADFWEMGWRAGLHGA